MKGKLAFDLEFGVARDPLDGHGYSSLGERLTSDGEVGGFRKTSRLMLCASIKATEHTLTPSLRVYPQRPQCHLVRRMMSPFALCFRQHPDCVLSSDF